MHVFQTPGHSADSVSYIVGSCLFSGDLHLATAPGIAGLVGWDSAALAASLETLTDVGRERGISLVIPAHGVPFPFEKAEKIFASVRKEALALADLKVLNRSRGDFLSEYVTVLLEETSAIFSIVAARLLKVSHYLEMLEEEGHAREILQLVDTDAIDRLVDDLYYFIAEARQGAPPLIAKAVQFVMGIDKIFAPDRIRHLLDPFLLRRLRSLLTDFVNAAYGIQFKNQEIVFDMNVSVRELLTTLKESRHDTQSIFDAVDEDTTFITELSKRIAYEPLFSSIRLDYRPAAGPAWTNGNSGLFQEAVSALLEQFAVSRVKEVRLECILDAGTVALRVTRDPSDGPTRLRDSKLSYFRHAMRMAGGGFREVAGDPITSYLFELPSPDKMPNGQSQ
jgi:hypothetical protein